MNIDLPEDEVAVLCQRLGVAISDIETLPNGGTHLVCRNSAGASEMRRRLAKSLIAEKVYRYAFYSPKPPGWRGRPSARRSARPERL
jgi:hypothetical protein